MDSLKANLASSVRNALFSQVRGTTFLVDDETVERATVEVISDLQTSIRIRTPNGPRYFVVQVKEQF
jgi:hypothetical protein